MGDSVNYVRAVVVDPHSLTGRDRNACARGVLYGDSVGATVVDEVDLLNGGNYQVLRAARSASQVQPHITRRLGCVGIRQRQGNCSTSKGNIRRPGYHLFDSCA